jgi:phosphopentomutase
MVCIIVLDSVGIGALPDAADFGDAESHTLGNIYAARGSLRLPNLYAMGLANISNSRLPGAATQPTGAFGRMAQEAKSKDTTGGHWEMMGLVMDPPFRTMPSFPDELLKEWLQRAGIKPQYLGNYAASGTHIIAELGEQHVRTGAPIVYTSADSVFQVAAHEDVFGLQELYRLCALARGMLTGENLIGRVIARPFIGEHPNFTRTQNRKDYAVPPVRDTILDMLVARGKSVLGVGKIEDIFCQRGITHINHTTTNTDGIQATIDALRQRRHDLVFTNLVDFDMLYGHRNDVEGYAAALEYFDTRLPDICRAMGSGDVLFITADHGCDPTTPSTDHSREYVPLLVYGDGVNPTDLGTRPSFADLGATVYEIITREVCRFGSSFLAEISR